MDVLLTRVGLSQFFQRLEDLKQTPQFKAARSAPRLPAHITRASAAAALDASHHGCSVTIANAGGRHPESPSKSGMTSYVQEDNIYDHDFAVLVDTVCDAAKQLTLTAFTGPAAGPGSQQAAARQPQLSQEQLTGQGPEEKLQSALQTISE